MQKNNLIGVTGVTCAGKDFLINTCNLDRRITVSNIGTLVGQYLGMDRDRMMGEASPEDIRSAQLSAYHQVAERQPGLVTCHAIREMPDGGLGYDMTMEKIFNPRLYVFVQAPPDVLNQRIIARNAIGERNSPVKSPADIAIEQSAKLGLMQTLASDLMVDLVILENIPPNDTFNTDKFNAAIENILLG